VGHSHLVPKPDELSRLVSPPQRESAHFGRFAGVGSGRAFAVELPLNTARNYTQGPQ
jgi:hypothetical protein